MNNQSCALCLSNTGLCDSHIVPQFFGDWLKRTSATGYLRGTDNPNLRRQDTLKMKLLCFDCEQKLSRHEKKFAESVFYPFQRDGTQSFLYTDWLLYFAVSLVWRVSLHDFEIITTDAPRFTSPLQSAMEVWRRFLLGTGKNAGPYQHHLFFFSALSKNNKDVAEKFHWYTLRAIEVGLYYTQKELVGYCKLPGMVFWSGINPPRRRGLKNTLIKKRGLMRSPQYSKDHEFGSLLSNRVAYTAKLTTSISQKQAGRIHQTANANANRVRASHSLHVANLEEYWRKRCEND